MSLKRVLQILGLLAVIGTLAPIFAADFWWVRIFDYPHIQLTLLTLSALAAYFIRFNIKRWEDYAFVGVLLICLVFQFIKIYPYTPLSPLEVSDIGNKAENEQNRIRLLTANVLQSNKKCEQLTKEVSPMDADLIVFTETNRHWQEEISKALGKNYEYQISAPLDNTYGMLMYSKFELIDPQVKYIVDDSIPSIHTRIKLPSGQTVQLYAVHPTPPMPQHNPSSTDRDAELMKVAKLAKNSNLPVIVMGDFNDVAWSSTVQLFSHVGMLKDIRIGRGFFNTFDATSFIMRWPLDHIFVSEEFRLSDMKVGGDTNSDHFPYFAVLELEPGEEKGDISPPSEEEMKEANKQIQKEEKENEKKN